MVRNRARVMGLAAVLAAGTLSPAAAQNVGGDSAKPATNVDSAAPGVARIGTPPASGRYHYFRHNVRGRHGLHPHDYTHYDFLPPAPGSYSHAPQRQSYPYLHAPLYPSPTQRVPIQVGATVLTNQALAPHEMLYPHEYHALYPPFYYSVRGHWMLTPLGVWSWDQWQLRGTEVEVEYSPRVGLLSGFFPMSGR